MAIAEEWFLDKVILPSSVEFQSFRNLRLDAGIQTMIERGAGEVHPNFIANQQQMQAVTFETPEIDTMLANYGFAGSVASVAMWFKKGATTGRVARATTSHFKEAFTTSCIYLSSIKLPHNGVGTADVTIRSIYDGSNAPLIHTGSSALSGSIATTDYFGAGPIELNGTSYSDVQDITINTGVELAELGGSSEVWNTAIAVRIVEVSIEVRLLRAINWGTAITHSGIALNGTSGFIAYGRKYSPDGTRVADATAGHVGISALDGMVIPLNTSGEGSNIVSDTFRVICRYNATADSSFRVSGATKIDGDHLFQNS